MWSFRSDHPGCRDVCPHPRRMKEPAPPDRRRPSVVERPRHRAARLVGLQRRGSGRGHAVQVPRRRTRRRRAVGAVSAVPDASTSHGQPPAAYRSAIADTTSGSVTSSAVPSTTTSYPFVERETAHRGSRSRFRPLRAVRPDARPRRRPSRTGRGDGAPRGSWSSWGWTTAEARAHRRRFGGRRILLTCCRSQPATTATPTCCPSRPMRRCEQLVDVSGMATERQDGGEGPWRMILWPR